MPPQGVGLSFSWPPTQVSRDCVSCWRPSEGEARQSPNLKPQATPEGRYVGEEKGRSEKGRSEDHEHNPADLIPCLRRFIYNLCAMS